MATLVRTPEGFFQSGSSGLIPITDPVQLRDLNSGNTPYVDQTKTANVPSPVKTSSTSGPGSAVVPAGGTGGDPYNLFNMNLASMLKQIQAGQTSGATNLGGARDTLNTESVTSAKYDPTMSPTGNIANLSGTPTAFKPAITSINTQLENTNSALGNLRTDMGTMASIFQPKEVAPGSALVTPGGSIVKPGHQYQPQVNPNTGLLDGFDITTGTWSSSDQSTGKNEIVAGVDLSGQATSTGRYATDPNYSTAVGNIYKSIATSTPNPTPETIDAYIKGHARSSSVTGQMIMNSASTYGIDPNLLTSVLAQESDFGTAGAATKTNNPGNVGNLDNGATQTFKSWQQGVDATAAELAKRKVPGQSAPQPQQATSPVGGSFSQMASEKVSNMPAPMRSYVDAGPKGVAYINDDRVPANLKDSVKVMASRAGIPYVQASDADMLKALSTVKDNIMSMRTAVKDMLNGSGSASSQAVGKGIDAGKTLLNSWFGVFPELEKFNVYRDTAINAVKSLAGGSGSGLRINQGEISANLTTLPKTTDNLDQANVKLDALDKYLDTKLAATFPYITKDSSPARTGGFSVTAPNGKSYSFPDQASLDAFKTKANIQ